MIKFLGKLFHRHPAGRVNQEGQLGEILVGSLKVLALCCQSDQDSSLFNARSFNH